MKRINIARDFSDTPLGRFPSDGEFNGTTFREDLLLPALKSADKVVVEIDGVEGYGSSFLEEAFGGLVRRGYFSPDELTQKLELRYADQAFRLYESLIWRYIKDAEATAATVR